MMNTLDCKNLACPEPVLQVRRYLTEENPETLTVLVDNAAACENVTRFLKSQGFTVSSAEEDGIWSVAGVRTASPPQQEGGRPARVVKPDCERQKILVVLLSNVLGTGDDTLGGRLMHTFLATLPEMGEALWRIVLLNGGVKLCIEGSPELEPLRALETQKVGVFACGTCLEYYGIRERMVVGQVTNMLDIVTAMQL
ncbi:MAG: sulfurtransferase-like selenium metabolism protein YedF, partial [Desulfovibrio sp.]|nr:sulfurtransferase-like selenium metabolism protein YedF [Desulfovibrio sp.]